MSFVMRNLVLIHVLALAMYYSWVHGGTRVEYLAGVPWIGLLALEWAILLPPTRYNEPLQEARRRVRRALLCDPALYISLALTLFLFLQWANGGRGVIPDPKTGIPMPQLPPVSWLPWCVERNEAKQLLYWFPPICAAMLAVRHGMSRRSQRFLLHLLVWNGACLALFGFVEMFSGTKAIYWLTPVKDHFFASFGYPNFAGAYFALLFVLGFGLWCRETTDNDKSPSGNRWISLLASLVCLAGVWGSYSRMAIGLTTLILLFGSGYMLAHMWRRMDLSMRIQAAVFISGTLITGLLGYYVFFPDNPIRAKVSTIDFTSCHTAWVSITERWFLVPTAWRIWEDHPWFGVGGWGFRSFVLPYMPQSDWPHLFGFSGAANVHNDAIQYLVEHGVVGAALILALLVLLLIPCVRGVWQARRAVWIMIDDTFTPPVFFQAHPGYLIIFSGAIGTMLHSLIDLPFRSPAVLLIWTIMLVGMPALLPKEIRLSLDKE